MRHLFDRSYLVKVDSMRNDYERFALQFAQSRESMRWAEFEVMYHFFGRFE